MNISAIWKRRRKDSVAVVALIVLISLSGGAGGARILTSLIKGYYKKHKKNKSVAEVRPEYCKVVMNRLMRDGLVTKAADGGRSINDKGKAFISFITGKKKPKPPIRKEIADTIIVFDIPEKRGKCRRYLRFELTARGFFSLQKSVWLGAGPLDADFLDFLAYQNIESHVHICSINKRGTLA